MEEKEQEEYVLVSKALEEYIQTYGKNATMSNDDIDNLEHKVFYILHSRERIEEYTFKGKVVQEWIAKYGPDNMVFKESEVLNFMKKHKIK